MNFNKFNYLNIKIAKNDNKIKTVTSNNLRCKNESEKIQFNNFWCKTTTQTKTITKTVTTQMLTKGLYNF